MRKELELYEILILLDPNLIEDEVTNKIQFYQDFLVGKGSKVMVQNQGRKGLSYAIKKFEAANFVQMVFLGNGKLVELFNSTIRRDEAVLRHIVTKLNEPLLV
jgi:small subunit ribosomal protein S6|tara:strand:- start:188 stop:496 length:309 start_codon:yes stop_codon:yes gene_type:complete